MPDMPSGLAVRPFQSSDSVTELTDLLHLSYRQLAARGLRYVATHQDEDITRRRIAGGQCFVATIGDRLVATITLKSQGPAHGCDWYRRPGVAYCAQLGVEPDLQRRGIGALLLDVVEQRAWLTGSEQIALDTSEQATDLIGWYGRRGYRQVQQVDWEVTNYRSVVLSKSLVLPAVALRPAVAGDVGILAAMLVESVNWDLARPRVSEREVMSRAELVRYVTGWGRYGDHGIVAEAQGGAPVAAAWFRRYSASEPGFGFVGEDVPEVSIAVRRPWRGHGLGGRLLAELGARAGGAGIRALSLSVETANPAIRLYRRLGYEEVALVGGSSTLRLEVPRG